jgi:aryl-alcohol dehydrogenase-like predicted oxidoreductase
MEMRAFGRTGISLSVLGFGCGAVGVLMVRGDPLDQERTIASAIAAGVNYFDTAVQYGNGESEKNLGRVLRNLKATDVVVGTKVRLPSAEFGRTVDAVATSLEGSLARLNRDRVDSSICTTRSPTPVAGTRSVSNKFSMTSCRRSSGCGSRVRHVCSG